MDVIHKIIVGIVKSRKCFSSIMWS